MQLRLLQLPKVKLAVRQRLIIGAAVSILLLTTGGILFMFFNSLPKESKAGIGLDLFTATLNSSGDQVDVMWVTEHENDNSTFTIERSNDAVHYNTLGQVDGSGTTSLQHSYSFIDPNPLSGISYYRLKQTDFSGEYSYGATMSVNNEMQYGGINNVNVYPIPAFNAVNVEVNSSSLSSSVIQVTDLTGKIAKYINTELREGINKIKLDISNLPNGVYLVNVQDHNGIKLSQKMIKTE